MPRQPSLDGLQVAVLEGPLLWGIVAWNLNIGGKEIKIGPAQNPKPFPQKKEKDLLGDLQDLVDDQQTKLE
jgi:hypothetical protein